MISLLLYAFQIMILCLDISLRFIGIIIGLLNLSGYVKYLISYELAIDILEEWTYDNEEVLVYRESTLYVS